MRKLYWVGFVGVTLVAALVLLLLLRPPSRVTEVAKESALPDISLQINRAPKLVIHQGTPLIFSVRLANQEAMNAAAHNEANLVLIEELEAALASGKISQAEGEVELARLRQQEAIRVVQLGDDRTSWDQLLHFVLRLPDGTEQALPWPVKLVAPPLAETVVLDADTTAELTYALDPTAAGQVPVGEYGIVTVLEVPAEAKLPADRWRGRVESEPVALKVVGKPARLAPVDEEKLEVDLARYFATTGEPARALEHANKALAANPKSIPALILVGDVKEAQGDLRGALAAYQNATREYYRKYPDSYEAPRYLLYKTRDLLEKLKGKP